MTSIRAKLYLLISVLLVFGSISAFMGTTGMNQGLSSMDSVYKNRIVPLRALEEIADAYAVSIVDSAHQVESGTLPAQEGLARIEGAEKLIQTQWALYLKTVLTAEEKQAIAVLEPQIRDIASDIEKLKFLLKNNDLEALGKFNDEDLYPGITPLATALSQLAEYQLGVAAEEYTKYREQYHITMGIQLLFIFASSVLGIGMAYWLIMNAVVKPLQEANSFATAIANGDLSGQIQVDNKDEIGQVLLSLMVMQTRLRIIVSEIQSKARELSSASGRLSEVTEHMGSVSVQQAAFSDALVDMVGNLTSNITHTSKCSETVFHLVEHSGTVAREGEEIVDRIEEEITSISNEMAELASNVTELNTLSDEVRNRVDVIRTLSTRTDQLAQEAASAAIQQPPQPQTFEEIANAVHLQAEQTAQTTVGMVQIIEKISERSTHIAQSIDRQLQRIQENNALAERVGTVVKTIDTETQEVLKTVSDISHSLEEQSDSSSSLNKYVHEISRASQEGNKVLEDSSAYISRLKQLTDKMLDSINQFRL